MRKRLLARRSRPGLLASAMTAAVVLLFTAAALLQANAASIKVMYPNGGEKLQAGQTVSIKWQSRGVQGPVVIVLYKKGIKHKVIARQAPNRGVFSWRIPRNVPKGNDFRIRIRSLKNLAVNDFSDRNFTIKK